MSHAGSWLMLKHREWTGQCVHLLALCSLLALLDVVGTEAGGDVPRYYLPPDGVWAADHGRLQDSWVLSQGTFHLHGPDPVAEREKNSKRSCTQPLSNPALIHLREAMSGQWDLEELITSSLLPTNQK